MEVQPHSGARRVWRRHVEEGHQDRHAGRWQERRVGDLLGGSRSRPRLHPGRHAAQRRVRRPSSRRQPVRQQPRRARREDRQAAVAFPDGPSRYLGLRHADGAEPDGHHGRRESPEGRGADDQAGLDLHVRSRDRSADLADAGDAGAEERRARRGSVADAADSVEAGAVLAAGPRRRRPHRLHTRDQGCGAAPRALVPDGTVLRPAVGD